MSGLNLNHVYRVYTLLLLKTESRHGYEIIDEIEEVTGDKPSTSHIYPFLSELEEEGFVDVEEGSRSKKIYSLTGDGEKFVNEQLNSFGEMLYAAVQDRVKECSHCDCKIYDGGYKKDGNTYCCEHCANGSREPDGEVAVAVPRDPETGKYLVLKRSENETSPGLWSFPGGEIEDHDDSIKEAALRELEEETGLGGEVVDSTDDFHWGGNVGDYQIHGFLVEVGSRKIELDHEHSDYRWVEIEEVEEMETVGKLKVLDNLGLR